MAQIPLDIENLNISKFDTYTKEQVVTQYHLVERELRFAIKEIYKLKQQNITDAQLNLFISEQVADLEEVVFGKSSEKYKKSEKPKEENKPCLPRVRKPSERYPQLPLREVIIRPPHPPNCDCCGSLMSESGLTEESEQINVIPKKYEIIRQQLVKYNCSSCHGHMVTTPAPLRIMEGSSYSDEMIIDVALSKYCDLVPIERYSAMAAREGVVGLPANSLIECSHYLSHFVMGGFQRLKKEQMNENYLNFDETPHQMLESHGDKSWYLWGYSSKKGVVFECHNTRSADVSSEILKYSNCKVIMSDAYTGYGKSVDDVNKLRALDGQSLIAQALCNVHARRNFFKRRAQPEAQKFLDEYAEIYKINSECKDKSPEEVFILRQKMRPHFEKMKEMAQDQINNYSEKSKMYKAMNYYLNYYEGLTYCLGDPLVSLDNNTMESLLRNPVIGRKTWLGTHSERGAKTQVILFSLVQSCKLLKVNPREYFPFLVLAIKNKQIPLTPYEYQQSQVKTDQTQIS
jgi:transposase